MTGLMMHRYRTHTCGALRETDIGQIVRLSGWCRAVPGDVRRTVPLGLRHYNLSISTSDQMIEHKFRGKLDREAVISEMLAAVSAAKDGGALTIGVVVAGQNERARQTILEEPDVAERVRTVIRELAAQHSTMLREGGGSLN